MSDWNPMERFTKEQYLYNISTEVVNVFSGHKMPVVNDVAFAPMWFLNREIRVFWDSSVLDSTVSLLCHAISKRIDFCDVSAEPFRIVLCGNDYASMSQINACTIDGQVDYVRLFDLCLSEACRDEARGGHQHADVFITTKPLLGDNASWGVSKFSYGTMLFALHGQRQYQELALTNLVMHETAHLLGMIAHCDDFQNVEGYTYNDKCNMHYNCLNKSNLCPKCTDFIRQWWTQVYQLLLH